MNYRRFGRTGLEISELVLGALDLDSDRGKLLLVSGMVLGSLGGLDTALREHLAGYRSHTTLLAGVCTVAVITPLALFLRVPQEVVLATALAVFGFAFYLLRAAFARRTGGLGFRV